MAELRCFYCGHSGPLKDFDMEHYVSRKAREERRRISPLLNERGIYAILPDTEKVCSKCNRSKQDKSIGQWARWLIKHPDKVRVWEDGDRSWFINWYQWLS